MDPVRLLVRAADLTPRGALHGKHLQVIRDLLKNKDHPGFAIVPSDTCYSLAAVPSDTSMSRYINQILRRPKDMAISLAFDGIQRVREWVNLGVLEVRLLENLTPGPLTVVCNLRDDRNSLITEDVLMAPRRTLGVRIPDSRIEAQLVDAVLDPVTTVAIRDPQDRPVTDFEQARDIVLAGLESVEDPPQIAIVETRQDFEPIHSTVVKVSGSSSPLGYDLLRPGAISEDQIQQALGRISQWELARY